MILPPLFELSYIGVAEPGVPNKERIILRPSEVINLAQCGILLGLKNEGGIITPLQDSFFWFGEVVVGPPSWIIIYTGSGQYQQTLIPNTEQTAYTFHWGKNYTLFNFPNIVPVIFRMGGILTGTPVPLGTVPQLAQGVMPK
ncbi:MAG: hypothetical protein AB1461_11545 [Thermodesulfobacteriota bacterium]